MLDVYTFQHPAVLEKLIKEKYYYFDETENAEFSFMKMDANTPENTWLSFTDSYKWMREEMLRREKVFLEQNKTMLWVWHNQLHPYGSPNIFDQRIKRFSSNKFVALKLRIPRERILLSDHSLWHFVLNYWLVQKTGERAFIKQHGDFYKEKPLSNTEGDALIRESWQRIFDLEQARKFNECGKRQQEIQGTIFDIQIEDLKYAYFFRPGGRGCSKIIKF